MIVEYKSDKFFIKVQFFPNVLQKRKNEYVEIYWDRNSYIVCGIVSTIGLLKLLKNIHWILSFGQKLTLKVNTGYNEQPA